VVEKALNEKERAVCNLPKVRPVLGEDGGLPTNYDDS